jgi:flagellar protein FlaJ
MRSEVREEPVREPLAVKFVSSHASLRELAVRISDRIRVYIPESGRTFSPYKFAAENVFFAFVATIVAVPLAFLLAILIHPAALVLFFAPFAVLSAGYLRIKSWTGERQRSLNQELPFFAVHASILQSAGRDMYDALCSTIGKGVFYQTERDAAIMQRNTSYFRMGPLEGLEELGHTSPDLKFRSLILGFSSKCRAGGDVTRYLERKTDELLKDHEVRWDSYLQSVSFSGELTIIMFFLLPIFLLMALFLAPGTGILVTQFSLAFGLPMVVCLCFVVIRNMQPKSFNELEGSIPLAAVLAFSAGAVSLMLSFSPWGCIAAIVAAGAAGYGLPVALQRRQIAAHESALPEFLRDVIEYQKLGYELTRAVIKIAEENTYNPKFDRLLAHITRQLAGGHKLSEVYVRTRSWMTKASFFFIGEVAECGAYQTESLELLTDFMSNVLRIRNRVRSSMHIYRWLALAAPLALGALFGAMMSFLGTLSSFRVAGVTAAPFLVTEAISPVIASLGQATVLFTSMAATWLASYAADFTPRNTCWITAGVAVAAAGIVLSSYVAAIMAGILG